jgi:hypothetical protein
VVLPKSRRRLMTPGARSTDLPRGPDALRAVKELTSILLKRQRERRYRQISQTRWAWCGSSGAGTVPVDLNADLTALSFQTWLVASASHQSRPLGAAWRSNERLSRNSATKEGRHPRIIREAHKRTFFAPQPVKSEGSKALSRLLPDPGG